MGIEIAWSVGVEATGDRILPTEQILDLAGLAFELRGIDELSESLRKKGYPVGEPHAALQGGRIVSVHHSGACGVPLAFIDFS